MNNCFFYHTMDLPGYGTVHGHWDLRGRESSYLGRVDFKGKSVLEVGTASGHLCFWMESQGAHVTAYDLSPEYEWDKAFPDNTLSDGNTGREHLRQLNNGFRFAHRAMKSNAKMVYGSVYNLPQDIGTFDIATFGSILLHLRDPFLALQRAAEHTRETIIVTDVSHFGGLHSVITKTWHLLEKVTGARIMRFLPRANNPSGDGSWWAVTPMLVMEMLKVLGFPNTITTFHKQRHENAGREVFMFTVVGRRTTEEK